MRSSYLIASLIIVSITSGRLAAGTDDHPAVGAMVAPVNKALSHGGFSGQPAVYATSSDVPAEFRGPKGGDSRKWVTLNSPHVDVGVKEIETGGIKSDPLWKIR